ncbi:hypothetical protein B0H16DRAFT_1428404 [Mycena metata]|uniref:Uncharacterized protein n=1 Tax=Mycena metata TaxID=1033252 RepID=A0AAD7HUU5_9AGAR|nr:hypothetical protein B0H16DRAFT_1428404 [Mycena metata]
MSENLPDEIISEILSPTLKVPLDLFSDTSLESPFVSFSSSCSSTLLVCKSWLRVATPLLYSFVIIRSKAQANALQLTLQTNPQLGNFVKHLRVENGYGMAMYHILAKTPNIVHTVISLQIQDASTGLVKGLPLINPTTLSIIDETDFFLKNQAVMKVITTIESCAEKWKNLTEVRFPYTQSMGIRKSLCSALCSCATVQVISWPTYSRYLAPSIVEFSQYPNIRVVNIRAKPESKSRFRLSESPPPEVEDARLTTLIRWEDTFINTAAVATLQVPLVDASFRPLVSTPQEIVDRIWSRVLFFAMLSLEQHPEDVPPAKLLDDKINSSRFQFLLVSRLFYRLALPNLYQIPVLATAAMLGSFSSALVENHVLGEHIRVLDLRLEERRRFMSGSRGAPSPTQSLALILPHIPNLRRLLATIPRIYSPGNSSISISWAEFSSLAKMAGKGLHELTGMTVVSPSEPTLLSPAVFNDFHALRSFTWRTGHFSDKLTSSFKAVDQSSAAALPMLEFLDVQNAETLTMFSQMRLPSLRRLALKNDTEWDGEIMRVHGSKIQELQVCCTTIDGRSIFELSPNITTLCWRAKTNDKHIYDLGCDALEKKFMHKSLKKIILDRVYPLMDKKDELDWDARFSALDVPCLPALREVCVPWCNWPTTERDIKKSMWVKWAEVFLKRGIKMTDRDGKDWAPRLKARGR